MSFDGRFARLRDDVTNFAEEPVTLTAGKRSTPVNAASAVIVSFREVRRLRSAADLFMLEAPAGDAAIELDIVGFERPVLVVPTRPAIDVHPSRPQARALREAA